MCTLVPDAALLKVTFHWGSAIETVFFLMDNQFPYTSSATVWGRAISLAIEGPISIFQLVNLIIAWCKMAQLPMNVKLETDEWREVVRQVKKEFSVGIPQLVNIVLAKGKILKQQQKSALDFYAATSGSPSANEASFHNLSQLELDNNSNQQEGIPDEKIQALEKA